jgi:alpha-1,2-mannosyltransferase
MARRSRRSTWRRSSRRSRRRLLAGGVAVAWFLCRLPWWGVTWLSEGRTPWFGRLLQNADLIGALLVLAMLWDVVRRERARSRGSAEATEALTPAGSRPPLEAR